MILARRVVAYIGACAYRPRLPRLRNPLRGASLIHGKSVSRIVNEVKNQLFCFSPIRNQSRFKLDTGFKDLFKIITAFGLCFLNSISLEDLIVI